MKQLNIKTTEGVKEFFETHWNVIRKADKTPNANSDKEYFYTNTSEWGANVIYKCKKTGTLKTGVREEKSSNSTCIDKAKTFTGKFKYGLINSTDIDWYSVFKIK